MKLEETKHKTTKMKAGRLIYPQDLHIFINLSFKKTNFFVALRVSEEKKTHKKNPFSYITGK